jgi:arylsulfatase A-like enzyme
VSLVDLVPTLLDASGIDVPEIMPGKSLMPRLRGSQDDWENCAFIQVSESQVGRAVRTKRWKYGVVARDKNGETDSESETYSEDYLYDLYSDPYELQNLIEYESHGPVCDHLRTKLLEKMNKAEEEIPEIIPNPRKKSGQRKIFEKEIKE